MLTGDSLADTIYDMSSYAAIKFGDNAAARRLTAGAELALRTLAVVLIVRAAAA